MRITVTNHDGEVLREERVTWAQVASFDAIAISKMVCSECRNDLAVCGANVSDDGHTMTGRAECVHCRHHVGTIRVDRDTVFGAEEDRAVLQGRPRVYG
jgi:hypothetical protein